MERLLKNHYFQCYQQNKVVCRTKCFFPQANGIAGFGGLNLFFYSSCVNKQYTV
jgi:hypothetical protein